MEKHPGARRPTTIVLTCDQNLLRGNLIHLCALMQEVVRTALTALYEAASHQSERIAELELDLKQKANKEDINAALAQKASSFDVSSHMKKVISMFTLLLLPVQLGLPAPCALDMSSQKWASGHGRCQGHLLYLHLVFSCILSSCKIWWQLRQTKGLWTSSEKGSRQYCRPAPPHLAPCWTQKLTQARSAHFQDPYCMVT